MLEIFQFDFMQRAFVAGIIIAIIAPAIGTFLVIRRYSAFADTLAHVSLAAVAVSLVLGTQPMITSMIGSSLAAIGIEKLRQKRKMFTESALTLFLAGSLGFTAVLLSFTKGLSANLFTYLFGSIVTVSSSDVIMISIIGVIVAGTIGIFYQSLLLSSLDEDIAKTSGVRVEQLNLLLIVLAAITVSAGMRVAGVLLVSSLMVIPVITAMQFKVSFKKTLILSIAISLFQVLSGLVASFYLDISSGGAIVLIGIALFLGSSLFARR